MASIATKLTKNLRLLSLFNNTIITKNVQRNLFAPSALGIDNFRKSQLSNEKRINRTERENIKKRLTDAVKDDNSKVVSEDLKKFLYLMRTDEETDLFLNSLAKYENSDIGVARFSFGSELMRYFYTTDKLEKAIQVFKNEKLKPLFNSPTALLVLLNRLSEEKRYTDVVKVFDHYLTLSPANTTLVTQDILRLISEALYYQRNAEAVAKSKEYMKLFKNDGTKMNLTIKIAHFILAFEAKDFEYAYELTNGFTRSSAIELNIKAIGLAGVNRFSESFQKIESILRLEPGFDELRGRKRDTSVYPSTLKYIRGRLEEAKNEAELKKFEELNERVLTNKRLRFRDFNDLIERVTLTRNVPLTNQQQSTDQPRRFDNQNRQQNTEPRKFNFQDRDNRNNFQQRRTSGGDQGSQTVGRDSERRPFRSQYTSDGASESQKGQQKLVNTNEVPKSTTIPPPPSTSS